MSEPDDPPRPQYPLNWVAYGQPALYASGECSINYVYAVDLETGNATPVDTLQLEDFEILQASVYPISRAAAQNINHGRPDRIDSTQGRIIIDKRVSRHISDDLFSHDISTRTRMRLRTSSTRKVICG